jgi:hypothetical protein
LDISLAFQSIWLPQRVIDKADPADPIGDYSAQGYSLGGFVSVGVLF